MVGDPSRLRGDRATCDWSARHRRAVTLVEILVVVVIIAILLGAVLTASSVLITRAHITNTEAVLTVVNEALIEFEREQKERPTLAKNRWYKKRYGLFPPDELEVFTAIGVPRDPRPRSLAPGHAVMIPAAPYTAGMDFFSDPAAAAHDPQEHRDLAAMILAIELLGDSSKAILDGLPGKNRTAGVVDAKGIPVQFLDRDSNGAWSEEDYQIRYILDDWGNPLSYFAQRDWVKGSANSTASTNHEAWNQWSTKMVRMNRGRPIIMSYGPDGADQLTKDAMNDAAVATIVGDLEDATAQIVDNPFNADNVFLNAELKEKLSQVVR